MSRTAADTRIYREKEKEVSFMTREEYNSLRYIRSTIRRFGINCNSHGHIFTIPVDGTQDYKRRLRELYTSVGFYADGIVSGKWSERMYDGRERIEYIPWNETENGSITRVTTDREAAVLTEKLGFYPFDRECVHDP